MHFDNTSVIPEINGRTNMRMTIYVRPDDKNLLDRVQAELRRRRMSLSGLIMTLLEQWLGGTEER